MSNSGIILKRFFKNIRLTDIQWDQLYEDIRNNESKDIICKTYNIKPHYFKAFKKSITGDNK